MFFSMVRLSSLLINVLKVSSFAKEKKRNKIIFFIIFFNNNFQCICLMNKVGVCIGSSWALEVPLSKAPEPPGITHNHLQHSSPKSGAPDLRRTGPQEQEE